mmetsp:Transcript_58102/g.69923  ORF Transcript_58102/g.69923 Transcript_58102/m.69923 type:complete len:638 (+) Transcript_58102:171-2084(+)
MSRRRGEFEHRTSIFEGAFRAWSYLGGLEPDDLENKELSDLDPLNAAAEERAKVDPRLAEAKKDVADNKEDGYGERRLYPYEPLPRSGLAHPFVQAILSPWLGPDAEQDAIQLGLTTLRTWWQHRRKGESGSAIAALGTDKMQGVVEGYTRHFFSLAHCLVTNDREQPPRTLHTKMKEVEKQRAKRNKKRAREEEAGKLAALALNAGLAHGLGVPPGLSKAVEKNIETFTSQSVNNHSTNRSPSLSSIPQSNMEMEGKNGHSNAANQGNSLGMNAPNPQRDFYPAPNANSMPSCRSQDLVVSSVREGCCSVSKYGDSETTPVVFISGKDDIQIAMSVEGITCAHCVKIVETVLKGCNGNRSPINGLLDASADQQLLSILIKIDKNSNAPRIAHEAARNLAMVGYVAKAKSMSVRINQGRMDLNMLASAFKVVASTKNIEVFDWSIPCTCPDNGILRNDCKKHSQMHSGIFQAFSERGKEVVEYMARQPQSGINERSSYTTPGVPPMMYSQMNSFNVGGGAGRGYNSSLGAPQDQLGRGGQISGMPMRGSRRESGFNRAMSGMSGLSQVDWENMGDFDVNVDHSAQQHQYNHGPQQGRNLAGYGIASIHGDGNTSNKRPNLGMGKQHSVKDVPDAHRF